MAAVVAAYVAALGHLAGGAATMSLQNIFNADTIRTWLMYRGLFLDADWDLAGWRYFPSTYLLDVITNWIMFLVGGLVFGSATRAQFLLGMYGMPLVWTLISAGGWLLVCRLVWGRDHVRGAAVLLAHALPFACFAIGQEYPFTVLFLQVTHTSTWAAMPWLLYLLLPAVTARIGWRGGWLRIGGVALAVFVVTFHDTPTAAWFTVPTLLAVTLACVVVRPRAKAPQFLRRKLVVVLGKFWLPLLLATMAATAATGSLLKIHVPTRIFGNPEILQTLGSYLASFWDNAAVMLIVWLVFCLAVLAYPLHRLRAWVRGGRFIEVDADAAGMSRTRELHRCVLPLWLAGTVSGTVVAGIVVGLADPLADSVHWGTELRYYLPAIWLPLFAGWALLPWRAPSPAVLGGTGLVIVASVGLVAINPPSWQRLNPFANDFHTCYAAHATEHGWVGGLGSHWYGWLLADPEVPLERFLRAGTDAGHGLLVSANNGHPSWGRGRFDFFVLSELEPLDTMYPPLDEQARTCNGIRRERCLAGDRHIGEKTVRKFHSDAGIEILECAGVRLARFAEPKNLNVSF